jgi:hypothetical protein
LSALSRAIEVLVIAQAAHLTASKFGGPWASGFKEDLVIAGCGMEAGAESVGSARSGTWLLRLSRYKEQKF